MPTKFTFTAPDEAAQIDGAPVVSPDGRRIAFAAVNGCGGARVVDPLARLVHTAANERRRDRRRRRAHWSPDGQSVAFGVPAQGRLKRVDLSSGFVQNMGQSTTRFWVALGAGRGQSSSHPTTESCCRVFSASGGTAEPATVLDPAKRENSHRFPHFLPRRAALSVHGAQRRP